MVELKILVVMNVTIMMLWLIEPKINWNRLLLTIESKNLIAIMIVSNFMIHDRQCTYVKKIPRLVEENARFC